MGDFLAMCRRVCYPWSAAESAALMEAFVFWAHCRGAPRVVCSLTETSGRCLLPILRPDGGGGLVCRLGAYGVGQHSGVGLVCR